MHLRRSARDAHLPSHHDDDLFGPRGDVLLRTPGYARRFADRLADATTAEGGAPLGAVELSAMALVHELLHVVLRRQRRSARQPVGQLREHVASSLGEELPRAEIAFLEGFPPPGLYRGRETARELLERGGAEADLDRVEELVLLWLTNQNRAYSRVLGLVGDEVLGEPYRRFTSVAQAWLRSASPSDGGGDAGESLLDILLAPSKAAPDDILAQLAFMRREWSARFDLESDEVWSRVLGAQDLAAEEARFFERGDGSIGEPELRATTFDGAPEEPEAFSPDLDWMPHVVLMAKTVFVWLDQLSRTYRRPIERLDQIPDEELDRLSQRGFTGLWLIGLFERSRASKKIKQLRGDRDAVASAYSLMRYDIAPELGGHEAYENLRERAARRGIRLAADMVPNHVGIDSDWVVRHPEWFIQTDAPPFPGYRFGGPDLSDHPEVGVFLEEGYWDKSDAAVVFLRRNRATGESRYLYHGNDGTTMPWNDTAQLDYRSPEVRRAVVETILHVARMFPIIRFDAAMTLAKRHVQRLWYPLPGQGGAIPSRSDHAMTREAFDQAVPGEFWREVVDEVAQRAPNTLLLAEAFWMMESYFVRSLGMHRVYNSAFMNMLKREENAKYRETVKNVLDFDPEILKRYVNFMSNPDEETAIAQFGDGDKYFGVCVLMATMPGLPMFGHGQLEGFREKYGMDYQRAKWDESPNDWLLARHEREIFPLLRSRHLTSGVERFAFYDFVTERGDVDEDVFAHSNGDEGTRVLVVFHNAFKATRGRIRRAYGRRAEELADALGLGDAKAPWFVFRDALSGLEYLRPTSALAEGFAWSLNAYETRVFTEFRAVQATAEAPYELFAIEHGDGGVPSVAHALRELRERAVHAPLRQALSKGHVDYLSGGWDAATSAPSADALRALEERLDHFADGLGYALRTPTPRAAREAELALAARRYARLLELHDTAGALPEPSALGEQQDPRVPAEAPTDAEAPLHASMPALALGWLQLAAAVALMQAHPAAQGSDTVDHTIAKWRLAAPVYEAQATFGATDASTTQLLLLAVAVPEGPTLASLHHALAVPPDLVRDLTVPEDGRLRWRSGALVALTHLLGLREVLDGRATLTELARDVAIIRSLSKATRGDTSALAATLRAHASPPTAH
jgi:glycosidase